MKIKKGSITKDNFPEEKGTIVITDSNVAKIYFDLIKNLKRIVIPAGEKSKSFEYYNKIVEKLSELEERGNRINKIISFGGGVVGDLSGFVASTYKRGIELIQVPTTLLAMVDSSIGGKNGINLGNKKNYLGTFYLPGEIIIDVDFLKTLPEEEIKNGIAEIIKYSFLFKKPKKQELLNIKNLTNFDFSELIKKCYKIKSKVVSKDITDKNYRHILNFGHTVGHAIEILLNISHGEAISIGMVKETQISIKLNKTSEKELKNLLETLNHFNMPTGISNITKKDIKPEKIMKMIGNDKKGKFNFALNKKNYSININKSIVKSVLE